jgi:selenocysteine lyase/cysteine desulfurase
MVTGKDTTDAAPRLSRRDALQQLGWLGALAGLQGWSEERAHATPLPDDTSFSRDPERYWALLRSDQFVLADDRIFLNPGSLGIPPRPVLEAMIASLHRGAEYATDNIERWGYEALDAERSEMAEFLGCSKEELAFTHNCTEGMSTIANGLDLKAGDEVVLTNQEHPGGFSPWRLKAARVGISAREVEIPLTPKDPSELADPLISAIGSRTRVIVFSGITSPTGLILPAREICQAARDRGVLSVIDGAHMDGQIHVNLAELGCDYFVGSPHKWMFAPAGCGLLYGRGDALDRLWPAVVTVGWDNKKDLHAARFMMIGTNNRASIHGMMSGLRFLKQIGPERVYARTHQLARMVVEQARRRSYLELVTPEDARFFHAIVSFRCKAKNLDQLTAALRKNNINVIAGERFRVSTQVHTRPSDIERLFAVCDSAV